MLFLLMNFIPTEEKHTTVISLENKNEILSKALVDLDEEIKNLRSKRKDLQSKISENNRELKKHKIIFEQNYHACKECGFVQDKAE